MMNTENADLLMAARAAKQFLQDNQLTASPIGHGLIHQTFLIRDGKGDSRLLLQSINQHIFKNPLWLIENYLRVEQELQAQTGEVRIPPAIPALHGNWLHNDECGRCWRATIFIPETHSPDIAQTAQMAFEVSRSFARFTAALKDVKADEIKPVIPNFHNLTFRMQQLETAIGNATIERLLKATHVIAEFRERKYLLALYDRMLTASGFPQRIMHHDCKISNILFNKNDEVVAVVDLDTVMPGKFFSDIGDMIRTMACTEDENSSNWGNIGIREDFYHAIHDGYLGGIGHQLTNNEKSNFKFAGHIMTFMQGIRFLTDFLQNDIYYKTNYPEQNLNRSLNQLILLENLEAMHKPAKNY